MTLIDQIYHLTPADSQTNLHVPFTLDRAYSALRIQFHYDPTFDDSEAALEKLTRSLPIYIPAEHMAEIAEPRLFLPLQNIITSSLAYESQYLGAHHSKTSQQLITISAADASPGYQRHPILPGDWELQFNLHAVISSLVTLHLRLEVIH